VNIGNWDMITIEISGQKLVLGRGVGVKVGWKYTSILFMRHLNIFFEVSVFLFVS